MRPGVQDTAEVCRNFMAQALQHWAGKNLGRLPNHVIVFRDGLSDGQLPTVGAAESDAMKNAIGQLAHSRPGSMITFTYVVIQKRITTRLFLLQVGKHTSHKFECATK
jgi:hypothetical protein